MIVAHGSEDTNVDDISNNFQSTQFPHKKFSTRYKHARNYEEVPRVAPVENFKGP